MRSINGILGGDPVWGSLQHQQLELNGAKKFMGGRMHLDLASVVVASDLELNWWSYGGGDVAPQLNLGLILIWTAESKLAQPYSTKVCN